MEPQFDFWHQLGSERVENTFDEETEAGGVNGGRLRARMRTLGDHELVTDPKYCGNGLLTRINDGGSSNPTRRRYTRTEAANTNFLQ